MEFKNPESWWKGRDHRKIKGARGQRFMSLKGHLLFGVAVVGALEYLMRVDDVKIYRAPPPPVEAPPPLPTSLSYTTTAETPYLKRLEVENALPKHVPNRHIDLQHLSQPKSSSVHSAYAQKTPT